MIKHIKVLYISDYVMGYHDNAYQSVVHTDYVMGYHDNAYQSVVHIRLCHGIP